MVQFRCRVKNVFLLTYICSKKCFKVVCWNLKGSIFSWISAIPSLWSVLININWELENRKIILKYFSQEPLVLAWAPRTVVRQLSMGQVKFNEHLLYRTKRWTWCNRDCINICPNRALLMMICRGSIYYKLPCSQFTVHL